MENEKTEILKRFCGTKDNRCIDTPFSQGKFSYATDGFIALRVPKISGIRESATPKIEMLPWSKLGHVDNFVAGPPLGIAKNCPSCHGKGSVTSCDECDGAGNLYFETEFNDYEPTCESCNGTGKGLGNGHTCGSCDGSKIDRSQSITWRDKCVGRLLMAKLKTLPNVRFDISGAPLDPIGLVFNGGDGFLMPISKHT